MPCAEELAVVGPLVIDLDDYPLVPDPPALEVEAERTDACPSGVLDSGKFSPALQSYYY